MILQLNTQFDPFTYDEMVKPLLYYKEAYAAAEAAYTNLAMQTEAFRNKANRDKNPIAYEMFRRYSGQLKNAMEDFSNGMTIANSQALLGLKRNYAKDIQPIAEADKRRQELADEQRKAMAANPTMLYERYASDMSLDDFIQNPSIDYGNQYSGALLTSQVAAAAANLAKEARDSENGKIKLKKLLPYQYEYAKKYGYSSDAVMKAILRSPNADQILSGIVDAAIGTSGVGRLDSEGNMVGEGWGNQATRKKAYDYATQGLWNAIGNTQFQVLTDQAGLTQLKADLDDRNAARQHARNVAAEIAREKRAAAREAAAARANGFRLSGNLPLNFDELSSANIEGRKEKEIAENALKVLGLDKNGKNTAIKSGTSSYVQSGSAVSSKTFKVKNDGNLLLWNKGKLYSKQAFIDMNKNRVDGFHSSIGSTRKLSQKEIEEELGKWYTNNVSKALKDFGYKGANPISTKDIMQKYNNAVNGSGAYTMSAVRLNFGSDSGNILKGIAEVSRKGKDTGIREVKSFDAKGNLSYGKHVKYEDLIDKDGKLKSGSTPIFYAHPNATTDGILFKYNGKMYAIPKRYLGSIADETYGMDIPTLREAYDLKKRMIKEVGEEAYYGSYQGQETEDLINQAGAAYIRSVGNSLGTTYSALNYQLKESNDSPFM